MWTDLGLNLDISGERLVTKHLILGMTYREVSLLITVGQRPMC